MRWKLSVERSRQDTVCVLLLLLLLFYSDVLLSLQVNKYSLKWDELSCIIIIIQIPQLDLNKVLSDWPSTSN